MVIASVVLEFLLVFEFLNVEIITIKNIQQNISALIKLPSVIFLKGAFKNDFLVLFITHSIITSNY